MVYLTKNDVQIHPLSSGLLFYYNNKLHVAFDMFAPIEFFQSLPLQKISYTDMYYEGHPVFEVKEYFHAVRIQELPVSQIKKMISTICEINEKSSKYGYFLSDIHEGNIAITEDGVTWFDMDAFTNDSKSLINSIALTCYLIQKYLYKNCINNNENYNINILKNTNYELKKYIFDGNELKKDFSNIWKDLKYFVTLFDENLPGSHWSDNYSNIMDIEHPENVNPKAKIVANIIDELEFKTVTDIGCNKGYFSFYAAKKAESVIGLDYDVACIQKAINFSIENNYKNVLFAVKDVINLSKDKLFESSRFNSDLILVLALTHHIKDILSIKEFVTILSKMSKQYILIEDIDAAELYKKEFNQLGYSLIKRVASYPDSRTLSLYKRN